jgi:formylmethanofuran dehydrogenase subunit E
MDGYYRRRSCLPFEEIRPLEIDEIEFVTDVGELFEEDSLCECSVCGEEVISDEDEDKDEENYCERCCRYFNEN